MFHPYCAIKVPSVLFEPNIVHDAWRDQEQTYNSVLKNEENLHQPETNVNQLRRGVFYSMAVATLQLTPYTWQRTQQFSKTQQNELANAVSKVLYNIISSDERSLERHPDLSWLRTFVSAYAGDVARHVLHCLVDDPLQSAESYWSEESHPERAIRKLTLQLASLLVRTHTQDTDTGSALNLSDLVDLAIIYAVDHPKTIGDAFADLFLSPPGLTRLFKGGLVSSLRKSLGGIDSHSTSTLACKKSYIVSRILVGISSGHHAGSLATVFIKDTGFVEAMAEAYRVCHFKLSDANDLDRQRWFRTKIELIDSFHALIESLLRDIPDNSHVLFDTLLMLLSRDSSSSTGPAAPSSTSMSPLNTQGILHDYEYAFTLSRRLIELFGTSHEDFRACSVIDSLRELVPQQNGTKTAGSLAPFLEGRKAALNSHLPGPEFIQKTDYESVEFASKNDKGKGKAVDVESSSPEVDSFRINCDIMWANLFM